MKKKMKNKSHITSLDVANYFLSKMDENSGELISNLKLQKLVYYAQGFHLAIYNKPLFDNDIEAWVHGPVVPELYHHFKKYEDGAIPSPSKLDFSKFSKKTIAYLDEIYRIFGQYSAWKLRNMTHMEPPWKETRDSGKKVIPHRAMKKYFKTQLTDGNSGKG